MAWNSYPRAASLPSAARIPAGFIFFFKQKTAYDIHDTRVASLASSAITQATTSSPGDRSSGAKFTTSRYRSWPTVTGSRLLAKRIGGRGQLTTMAARIAGGMTARGPAIDQVV